MRTSATGWVSNYVEFVLYVHFQPSRDFQPKEGDDDPPHGGRSPSKAPRAGGGQAKVLVHT